MLEDGGRYRWEGLRDRLITRITLAANLPETTETSIYYEPGLAALERLVIDTGFLNTKELDRRTAEYATGQWTDAEE